MATKLETAQKEAQVATQKAQSANSFLGILKNTISAIPKETGKVATQILQTIARSVGTAGVTAGNIPTQIANKTVLKNNPQPLPFQKETPTTGSKITEAIFGGLPIRTLGSASQNAVETANRLASTLGSKSNTTFGAPGSVASKLAGVPLAFAGIALDLSGFGGKTGVKALTEVPEQFLKFVAKEQDASIIRNTLNKIGLDDVNSQALSSKLAPTKTVDEVKNVLANFGKETGPVNRFSLTNKNPFANPEASSDTVRIQELKNSINEGKTLLKNKNLPKEEQTMIARSIENAQSKIGVEKKDGYTVEEISSDQIFNKPKSVNILPPKLQTSSEGVKIAPTARQRLIQEGKIAPGEKVSPIDRLILEGKVRVVSRNNRDTYQIREANNWKSVRDEDSAVKQATKLPKPPTPAQEERRALSSLIDYYEQEIAGHPGKILQRFSSKNEGQFLDFKNPDLAKTPSERERIITRNRMVEKTAQNVLPDGFDNPDVIRSQIDDYNNKKAQLESIKQQRASIREPERPKTIYRPLDKIDKTPKIDTSTGVGRSLEIVAQEALEKVDPLIRAEIPSLPEIIDKIQTPVKNKINIIDYIRTPDKVLKKIGMDKEAEKLRDAYEGYIKELPKNIQKITDWSKRVSEYSNIRIFKYLDGGAIDLAPKEKQVAQEIKQWLKLWAVRLDLPEDNTIGRYITHIFDDQLVQKEFDEDLAKIITDKIPGQIYDPFLEKRLGVKGYVQDTWRALDAYVKRATRKAYMDPVLEEIKRKAGGSLDMANIEKSQWEYLQRYINGINMRPTEIDNLLDNSIKSAIGYRFGQRPVTAITRTLRQMTYRGMLGLNLGSALRNLSQGINTYATLGEKYTALGYLNMFKRGALKELEEEGVLNIGFIQDRVMSSTKKTMERLDKALFIFFDSAEKINRGAAYFGAKHKGLAKGMTESEAIKYAKSVVRKTQFSFGSIDLPVALQTDIVKTLSQFGTFSIKQAEFLAGMAKDKNFVGLLRYALAGLAFVYTIGRAFGMEKEELVPFYTNISRGQGAFGSAPSLNLPKEIGKALLNTPDKYGKLRDIKQKLSDIGKAGIGLIPAGTQGKKTIEGIKAVNDGKSKTKGGKTQFKVGGTLGKNVQAILFGKYANKEAKKYFSKLGGKKKKSPTKKPTGNRFKL